MHDDLSISFDDQDNCFINRIAESGEIVQGAKLEKRDILMVLLPALADIPDFSDRMLLLLENKGLARPSHK